MAFDDIVNIFFHMLVGIVFPKKLPESVVLSQAKGRDI